MVDRDVQTVKRGKILRQWRVPSAAMLQPPIAVPTPDVVPSSPPTSADFPLKKTHQVEPTLQTTLPDISAHAPPIGDVRDALPAQT
jgi:hypothetical protein